MQKFLFLISFFLFCFFLSQAQNAQDSSAGKDTTTEIKIRPLRDSINAVPDSTNRFHIRKLSASKIKKDSLALRDTLSKNILAIARKDTVAAAPPNFERSEALYIRDFLRECPDFNFLGTAVLPRESLHIAKSYDKLFYLLLGLLFYFAFFRIVFAKYMDNLFTLFFRVSLRHQQIREQVLQSPLPSLLLNFLFIGSGGLYACFLIRYYHFATHTDFWLLLLNCIAILGIIYLAKFLLLKAAGWIFNISRATDTYIFIVFLVNKILGIFLLPFLVIISFSGSLIRDILVTMSMILVFVLFCYRFIISFGPVRKEIKVNAFHFFLYICAFEITPLLLIYKVLLSYLEKAY